MESVSILGVGQTKVEEHWDKGLRHLASEAVLAAMQDAGVGRAGALYVGNMLGGQISGQGHLGALIADFCNLRGIEAVRVEAACASGAAALRAAYGAVAGGIHDIAIVCGVEKMTDQLAEVTASALATATDSDYEAVNGLSLLALSALLMRRYMHEYGVPHEAFAGFAVNAHRNGARNPNAMFQSPITAETFLKARMVADPINLMDSAPVCDGAAALVLCRTSAAREHSRRSVQIIGSAATTDALAVHDRRDPLFLQAAHLSAAKAYQQADVRPQDIDLFELHDAFGILAALSLEACGFAERGQGTRLAAEDQIGIAGRLPISTMGGLKARGHPVGATGVYQVVEAALQLRGEAGANQVPNARIAMTQNIGGSGGTTVTHILSNAQR